MTSTDQIVMIIVMPIMFLFFAWTVWIILEWRKLRHKSELQKKIVDKFSSPQELNDFLQSKEGSKFLDFLKFNGQAPREKILSTMTKGIVSGFVGISLICLGLIFTAEMKYFAAFGIVIVALAAGFLISSYISFRLSKKWGIIDTGF